MAKLKHGLSGNPIYQSWNNMMQRCHNPSNHKFPKYGGVGIFVCERWHNVSNFFEDMGSRPNGTSIDRIDNKLGYFKENCRWATPLQQSGNTWGKPRRSQFKGIVKRKDAFRAYIRVDGKNVYLGSFKKEEDAARAYDVAAKNRFGQFAHLNFPGEQQ